MDSSGIFLPRVPTLLHFLPLRNPCAPNGRRVSDSPGVRVRQLSLLPLARALERLDGVCLVDVDHGVELLRESRVEVVRDALGLGPVDDPDRPLRPPTAEPNGIDEEARRLLQVEEALPAPR